jgi:PPK2 family polyphosphate:nucleotide phosphotransferase
MFQAPDNPWLVPYDGSFRVRGAHTDPPDDAPKEKTLERDLARSVTRLNELQEMLNARDDWSVLLIFQALDAAGKDGTIRAMLTGVNPMGVRVASFKQPSSLELNHDFLWRTARELPERGQIAVYNRSYYEEVLVVRVHPELLEAQRLPAACRTPNVWDERLESIAAHELHLARNGVVVLKFWLNVSRKEQLKRFLARLEEPEKNWKFAPRDVEESRYFARYMDAYEKALAATSRPWAPWYAIPADDKDYMRATVAETVVNALETLGLRYPEPVAGDRKRNADMRRMLEASD